jgi:hypothetical protein
MRMHPPKRKNAFMSPLVLRVFYIIIKKDRLHHQDPALQCNGQEACPLRVLRRRIQNFGNMVVITKESLRHRKGKNLNMKNQRT